MVRTAEVGVGVADVSTTFKSRICAARTTYICRREPSCVNRTVQHQSRARSMFVVVFLTVLKRDRVPNDDLFDLSLESEVGWLLQVDPHCHAREARHDCKS